MLIALALAALTVLVYVWLRNTAPEETLYRCLEEGENSALYLRRVRRSELRGNCGPVAFPIELRIEEFCRITCAPGVAYVRDISGWFSPGTCRKTGERTSTYEALLSKEGKRIWQEQIKVTRKVAQGLRKNRYPHQGFAAT